jgi:hypothetical protein
VYRESGHADSRLGFSWRTVRLCRFLSAIGPPGTARPSASGVTVSGHVFGARSRSFQSRYLPTRTTVDLVAFGLAAADFDDETNRLEALGHDLRYTYHEWVQWRSAYFANPDGNSVELVCFDPTADSEDGQ